MAVILAFDWPILENVFDNYRNVTCQLWCLYNLPQSKCCNIISLTKFVIVQKYDVPYILYTWFGILHTTMSMCIIIYMQM